MNPVSNFPRSDPIGSPNAQDILEKRRRQIERVRAANLSKQLQVRLRYARLKVDHGWQKQTLNEVENLYFHHYREKIASVSDSHPISKPKKLQKVHSSPKADKDGNATASRPSGSTTAAPLIKDSQTLTSMDVHLPSVTHPHPPAAVKAITSTDTGDINPASSTLASWVDPGNEAVILESSQFTENQHQSNELSLPGSNPSGTSLESLSPIPRSEPSHNLNTLKSGIIPTSSTTQTQNSTAVPSGSTSHPGTTSSSLAILTSPSSNSNAAHASHTRAPSKLPIPRLPAVSYPYTGSTSPASLGKARKTVQLPASLTATRYSASSSSPSITSIPLLSPYKSTYTSSHVFPPSPSTSTALQTAPSGSSLGGNSSENSSLPLTYDSFWSSHTSSSSLPPTYRSNLNTTPFAFSSSSSTLPTTSSTVLASTAPSVSTSLSATSTSTASPNFSFASYPSSSTISSLSHSPMVPSLLHSQGLALFQQAVHSPPTVGASNQNASVG